MSHVVFFTNKKYSSLRYKSVAPACFSGRWWKCALGSVARRGRSCHFLVCCPDVMESPIGRMTMELPTASMSFATNHSTIYKKNIIDSLQKNPDKNDFVH